ncbi:hypothetical protein CPB84DRAFT_1688449 [Gymnopilus junonius]|uniref:Uncharacterized protein n=1 Tax=Gymnopilus junonius TaxID=109634 RepID=A0A9P5NDC3_GYMJU|nr:hypothetical protein CPB84DRAFT_1688449 [Gymnopilus junonius]
MAVQELNCHYCAVPTFGRSMIQRFWESASNMKKLAARNYEDLLQCTIPFFEGLLPEPHNAAIASLLFMLAEWHTLAKLQMHTKTLVNWLQQCTTNLSSQMRRFKMHTCSSFVTRALPKEEAACGQGQVKKAARRGQTTAGPLPTASKQPHKVKLFNLFTYKYHSLGNYMKMILQFGTTDLYST